MAQGRRRHERRVLDAHAVVDFVALLQPAQYRDGVLNTRLGDIDRLETPLQRRVFLDVLAILVERGRANAAQLAARELGLEHVRRVGGTLGLARADDGVQLVDEENDAALGGSDFFQKRLEPLLELAAKLRARHHRRKVHRHDALVLERLRHIAVHDALGEALHDGGLAHARLADEHGIVLRATREHLHHTADFVVAPDDRVNLPLPRERGEVLAVFLQRLKLVLRVLVGHALVAAQVHECLEHRVARELVGLEQLLERLTAFRKQAEEQVLGGEEFVLQLARLGLGGVKGLLQVLPEVNVAGAGALHFMPARQFLFQVCLQHRQRDAKLLDHQRH